MNSSLSPQQEFLLAFISNVGCMSWRQAAYMLYKKYGLNYTKSGAVINYLCNNFYIHRSPNEEKWICYGKEKVATSDSLNADTIRAISVALEVIEDPDDFGKIYKPSIGTDLTFYCDDTIFEVINTSTEHINKVMHFQKQFETSNAAITAKGGADLADEVAPQYLIVFGSHENPKRCVDMLSALDLTFPHSIVFLQNKDIFDRNSIKVVEPR